MLGLRIKNGVSKKFVQQRALYSSTTENEVFTVQCTDV